MRTYNKELEDIANDFLQQAAEGENDKPNFSNRDFMNVVIIFQTALMDKMYDCMDFDRMPMEDRLKMAESCGSTLHKLIHTYTGLDVHKVEDFL